jgi:hypothetical protein
MASPAAMDRGVLQHYAEDARLLGSEVLADFDFVAAARVVS